MAQIQNIVENLKKKKDKNDNSEENNIEKYIHMI